MKHKHYECIVAFAEGIECEYFSIGTDRWVQINDIAVFSCDVQVRIKPEPQYLHIYRHIDTSKIMMSPILMKDTSDWDYLGKVRVEK